MKTNIISHTHNKKPCCLHFSDKWRSSSDFSLLVQVCLLLIPAVALVQFSGIKKKNQKIKDLSMEKCKQKQSQAVYHSRSSAT